MHQSFQAEQWLPHPVEHVFAFFGDPANLPRLMPAWQHARIDTASLCPPPPPPDGEPSAIRTLAGDGSTVRLSFRPLPLSPVRLTWDASISGFLWYQQFCDTQTHGPFAFWHHCHKVASATDPLTGAIGSLLRDEIEFQLPLHPFSAPALPLVRLQIARMFRFRQQRTLKLLAEAYPPPPPAP